MEEGSKPLETGKCKETVSLIGSRKGHCSETKKCGSFESEFLPQENRRM